MNGLNYLFNNLCDLKFDSSFFFVPSLPRQNVFSGKTKGAFFVVVVGPYFIYKKNKLFSISQKQVSNITEI